MKALILIALIDAVISGCNNMAYCGMCNSQTGSECELCWGSYYYNGNCTVPKNSVNNCMVYEKEGFCKICKYKNYLTKNGTCSPISDPLCNEMENNNCVSCLERIPETNKNCSQSPQCRQENCIACRMDGSCVICKPDYILTIQLKCVQTPKGLENCVLAKDRTCISCKQPYWLRDGQCILETQIFASSACFGILSIIGLFMFFG